MKRQQKRTRLIERTIVGIILMFAVVLGSPAFVFEAMADDQVATPTFSPAAGTYTTAQTVSINCVTGGATIHYTTDGSEPTASSTLYSSAIEVAATTTIKAKAFKDGMTASAVAEAAYTINSSSTETVATPTFSLPGGTYAGTQNVEISCATEGATIYYTIDGDTPTDQSDVYNGAITVEESKTIKAIAVKEGLENSEIAEAEYIITGSTSGVTILNDGYPYGKNMSTGQITLVVEAESTETLTYQWEIASTKDGTFASISGATESEYTFAPDHGKWYRCMVNGVASYAVQAVKPKTETESFVRKWTKPYANGEQWYLSNGPVAYTVINNNTVQGFDVVGEYEKDGKTYMLCTSYGRWWDVYKGDDGATGSKDMFATLPKMMFSFSDHGVMITASGLAENGAPGNFSFGCDTQLGDGDTSGDYSDKAALIASLNKDRTLKQIAMIGAASKADAKEEDPAFVIAPAGNPMFWIGGFSSRETFSYNTSGDENNMSSVTGSEVKVVTSVEGADSGMTMSWKNVTEVSFGFAVGTAADTGAISADVNYAEEKITGLDPNTEYVITVLDKTTGQPLDPPETYTIKALPHEAGQPGKGYILLEGEDTANNSYDLTGKMISIAKAGSDDEPGELEIGARPDPTEIETNDPGANTAGKPIDIKLSDAEITATTISIIIDPKDDNAEAKKKQEYRLVAENGSELTYSSSPAPKTNGWTMPDSSGRIMLSGLTPNTKYKIQTRIPYTDNSPASSILEAEVKTACEITVTVPSESARTFTPDGTPKEAPAVTVSGGSNPSVAYSTALSEPYSTTLPSFLAGGQYTVYYRITQTGSETIYGTYIVTIKPTITFDANGGTLSGITANNEVTKISDDKVCVNYGKKPNSLSVTVTNDGKNLAGWYTDEGFKNLYWATNSFSAAPEVVADMTLYARWVDASSTISIPATSLPGGTIRIQLQKGGIPIPNSTWATVDNGSFLIGTVPDDEYDLVIEKNMSGVPEKNITITSRVKVEGGNITFLDGVPAFPSENISSVVTVEPGAPAVVVSGLELEAAAEDNGQLIHWEWEGGEQNPYAVLELKFGPREDMTGLTESEATGKLKSTEEKNIHKAEKAIIALAGNSEEPEFFDISVIRTDHWDGTSEEIIDIHELSRPIEIAIPYTAPAGKTIRVFRYHNNAAQELTSLSARITDPAQYQDGKFYVGDGVVYIYSKYFSIYAVNTQNAYIPTPPSPSVSLSGATISGGSGPNGAPRIGDVLSANAEPSYVSNITYEWFVDGVSVEGATGNTYVPKASDLGKKISVKITQRKGQPNEISFVSPETEAVRKKVGEVPSAEEIKDNVRIVFKTEEVISNDPFELSLDPNGVTGSNSVSITDILDNADPNNDKIYVRRKENDDSDPSEWVVMPIGISRPEGPSVKITDNSENEKGSALADFGIADKGKEIKAKYKGTDGEWHDIQGSLLVGEDGTLIIKGLPKGDVELRLSYAATENKFRSIWWTGTVRIENGASDTEEDFGICFAELSDDPYDGVCYNADKGRYEIVYTGNKIQPLIKVTSKVDGVLKEGIDYLISYSNNKNVSKPNKPATIKVNGKGFYKSNKVLELHILPVDLEEAQTRGLIAGVNELKTLSGKKLGPVIVYRGYKLSGRDFEISNKDKITADTTTDITGKGNFTGTLKDVQVKVIGKDAQKNGAIKVNLKAGQHVYNGGEHKLTVTTAEAAGELTVTAGSGKAPLAEDTDFVVSYSRNIFAGKASVTVTGIGDYNGTVTKNFTIEADKTSEITAELSEKDEPVQFNVRGAAPDITVTAHIKAENGTVTDEVLKEGKDYKVTYSSNKKVGDGAYTVKFLGNYKGHKAVKGSFKIVQASIDTAKVEAAQLIYKKPGKYLSKPFVSLDGVQLKTSDYTVKYYEGEVSDVTAEGVKELTSKDTLEFAEGEESKIITIAATGKGNYTKTALGTYEVVKAKAETIDLTKAKIVAKDKVNGKDVKVAKQEYTGYAIEPEIRVIVKVNKVWTDVDPSLYDISYINNVNKGSAVILVNGNGTETAGSKNVKFSIINMNMNLFKVLSGK